MRFLLLALRVFLLDHCTKRLAERIEPDAEVVVIKDVLSFRNVKNRGAAGGLLENNPLALTVLTAVAIIWFVREIFTLNRKRALTEGERRSMAYVAGGALGNLFDRARHKHVTDFIQIRPKANTPVFNVADVFILTGAISFVWSQMRHKEKFSTKK